MNEGGALYTKKGNQKLIKPDFYPIDSFPIKITEDRKSIISFSQKTNE